MLRDRRVVGAVLAASALFAFLIGSAVSQQRVGPTVADPEAVVHAESLSRAFRSAANSVLPTVVKLKSRINERRVTRGGGARGENPFRGTPFEDFFGDEFLGPLEERIPRSEGTGSGVIIDAKGIILTNNHVVKDADVVVVELPDGREFKADDIRTDPQTDLAVIRIPDAGDLTAARLGDSDEVQIGDWVLAVGNPFELEASVSAGIISAKGRSLGAAERASFLQTDAAINPGNSGGPLVNLRGEVVGINTAIASSSGGYQGIGFAIPVNLAKWVIGELLDKGSVSRGWLGIGISAVNQELAEQLGIDARTQGVVVQQVGEDTPAERAGLRTRDIITHFGGQPVSEPSELQRAVERAPLGSRQPIRVIRDGKVQELSVETEALPADLATASGRDSRDREQPGIANEQLGMKVADLTAALRQRLELPTSAEGVVVVEVSARGIASLSGLRPGMLITEVDGKTIDSAEEFESAMGDANLEKGVSITVRIPGVGTRFLILRNR